jgi:AraC-like DNA-binding protein
MSTSIHTNSETFIEKVSTQTLIKMFDLIPDTLFWIKDIEGKFVHANQFFIEHSGQGTLLNIIGKSDDEISPPHLAKQYRVDDQKVIAGELITDRIELNMSTTGEFGWYSTSKRPLFDDYGTVIGTYGFTHHIEHTSQSMLTIEAIKGPVEFVKLNYHRTITVHDLAEVAFLSVSAIERRFKKHLGITPKQFINKIRLENARRMLIETELPIEEIAFQCGFAEHSYFSRQFKIMFDFLPSQLRLQMQQN